MEDYIFSRLEVIRSFFQDNIKTLENKKVTKLDKDIARNLINEKVFWLIKDFAYIKLFSKKDKILSFQHEIRSIQNMLFTYLINHPNDVAIAASYKRLLVIL